MRLVRTTLVIFIVTLFFGIGTAGAVGYDRHEVNNAVKSKQTTKSRTSKDLSKALREATFIDKCPAAIDQVVFFVKDILGQFGITKPSAPKR